MVRGSFVSFKIQQKPSNKEGYQKRKILRFQRAKSTNHLRRKANSNKQSKKLSALKSTLQPIKQILQTQIENSNHFPTLQSKEKSHEKRKKY